MNFKNLIKYQIPEKSDDWFKFRYFGLTEQEAKKYNAPSYKIGIGASGIGNVLRLTYKYDVLLKLFNQMIGRDNINYQYDNRMMFFGRINEDLVGNLWQCWDGEGENYIEIWKEWKKALKKDYLLEYKTNKFNTDEYKAWDIQKKTTEADKVLFRKYNKIPMYLVNLKYPRLYCSLDGWANNGSVNMITGEIENNGFPVEFKTISTDRARSLGTNNGLLIKICNIEIENYNKGNFNIPLSYIAQVQQQMLITDSNYAELAVLIGGNELQVNKYIRNNDFCKLLNDEANIFCEKVEVARKSYKILKTANNEEEINKCNEIINNCEPGGSNEEKYLSYVSDNYFVEKEIMKGTDEDKNIAMQDELYRNYIKYIKEKKTVIANKIAEKCKNNRVEEISLGDMGKIEWRFATKRSSVRSSNVRIKKDFQPDVDFTQSIINSLPKKY